MNPKLRYNFNYNSSWVQPNLIDRALYSLFSLAIRNQHCCNFPSCYQRILGWQGWQSKDQVCPNQIRYIHESHRLLPSKELNGTESFSTEISTLLLSRPPKRGNKTQQMELFVFIIRIWSSLSRSEVYLEGSLRTRKYADKKEIQRSVTEVVLQPNKGSYLKRNVF